MSKIEDSQETKKLILKILKTIEELKATVSPLIKEQDYAQKALKTHADALEDLIGALVTLKKDQEIIQRVLSELKDYSVDPKLYQELEDRISRLENVSISKIVEKVKLRKKIPESELRELEFFVKRKPKEPSLWLILGIIYYKKDRIEKALECFDKAIQIDSENVHAWCSRGTALQRLGKHEEAFETFETARKFAECPIIFRYEAYSMAVLGKTEEALNLVNLAIQGDKEDAISWSLKGRILSEMGRDMEALGCIEKALELQPDLGVALSDKGIILMNLGPQYYEEAFNYLDKAVQLIPKSPVSWHNKGVALHKLGRDEEAIECFNKTIELDPKSSCAYCYRGICKAHLGNMLGALEDFNKAVEIGLREDCTDFYVCKASTLRALERYEEALKDVNDGLMIDSKKPELWLEKTWILVKLERIDEAKKHIETAIQIEPTGLHALNGIAYSLYLVGEYSKALDFANKVIQKEPNDASYLDTLACILYKLGQDENALETFKKALELRKSDMEVTWPVLAELYNKMGKSEEAKEAKKIAEKFLSLF